MDLNFSCNENANNKEISSNSINVTTSLAVNLLPSHSSFLHSTAIPSQQVTSLKSSENFLQTVPENQRERKKGRPRKPPTEGEVCGECGKTFSNYSSLLKHAVVHSEQRSFVCGECNKSFKRQDHLVGHMATHNKNKHITCSECERSYCDQRSLQKHIEVDHHHSQQPFHHHQNQQMFLQNASFHPQQYIFQQSSKMPSNNNFSNPQQQSVVQSSFHPSDSFKCYQFNQNNKLDTDNNVFNLPASVQLKNIIKLSQEDTIQQHAPMQQVFLPKSFPFQQEQNLPNTNRQNFLKHSQQQQSKNLPPSLLLSLLASPSYNMPRSAQQAQLSSISTIISTQNEDITKNKNKKEIIDDDNNDESIPEDLRNIQTNLLFTSTLQASSPPPQLMSPSHSLSPVPQQSSTSSSMTVFYEDQYHNPPTLFDKLGDEISSSLSQATALQGPLSESHSQNVHKNAESFSLRNNKRDQGLASSMMQKISNISQKDKITIENNDFFADTKEKGLNSSENLDLNQNKNFVNNSQKLNSSGKTRDVKEISNNLKTDVDINNNVDQSSSTTTSNKSSVSDNSNQFRSPGHLRSRRGRRLEPLIMPPKHPSHPNTASNSENSSGGFGFHSHLRSPRIIPGSGCYDSSIPPPFNQPIIPYTPPPMLSPIRSGSGLFCLLQAASSILTPRVRKSTGPVTPEVEEGLVEEVVTDESSSAEEAPTTDVNPHINVGSEYQAVIPEFIGIQENADQTDDHATLMYAPRSDDVVAIEQALMDFSSSACVVGNGTNKELFLHLLHAFNGDVKKSCLALITQQFPDQVCSYTYPETVKWSIDEIETLQNFLSHKDFYAAAIKIGTKTCKQCVEQYYVIKKVLFEQYRRSRYSRRKEEARFNQSKIENEYKVEDEDEDGAVSSASSKRSESAGELRNEKEKEYDAVLGEDDSTDENDACDNLSQLSWKKENVKKDQENKVRQTIQTSDKIFSAASNDDLQDEVSVSTSKNFSLPGKTAVRRPGRPPKGRGRPPKQLPPKASMHVSPLHDSPTAFPCKICKKVFYKVKSRSAHMKSHRFMAPSVKKSLQASAESSVSNSQASFVTNTTQSTHEKPIIINSTSVQSIFTQSNLQYGPQMPSKNYDHHNFPSPNMQSTSHFSAFQKPFHQTPANRPHPYNKNYNQLFENRFQSNIQFIRSTKKPNILSEHSNYNPQGKPPSTTNQSQFKTTTSTASNILHYQFLNNR